MDTRYVVSPPRVKPVTDPDVDPSNTVSKVSSRSFFMVLSLLDQSRPGGLFTVKKSFWVGRTCYTHGWASDGSDHNQSLVRLYLGCDERTRHLLVSVTM